MFGVTGTAHGNDCKQTNAGKKYRPAGKNEFLAARTV